MSAASRISSSCRGFSSWRALPCASCGWPLVVVSNQSGIGRGYFDEAAYQRLTDWMCERFRAEQAPLARVYHCPYHPTHGVGAYRADHDWRKPKPGMILQAAADLNLDLVAIGSDRRQDRGYRGRGGGRRAAPHPDRCASGMPPAGAPPHHVVRNLAEALSVLRTHTRLKLQHAATWRHDRVPELALCRRIGYSRSTGERGFGSIERFDPLTPPLSRWGEGAHRVADRSSAQTRLLSTGVGTKLRSWSDDDSRRFR